MVFDIEEIGDEGLDFDIHQNQESFPIEQADCSLNKAVEVRGRLTRMNEDVFLMGRVRAQLTLNCSRCLEPFDHRVENILKAHFVPREKTAAAGGEIELHAADIDTEFYEDNRIDLTQSVRDGILLTVPVTCLCDEKCKGLCPGCGMNLNQGACDCPHESPVDPRFEVLKILKEKLK